MYQQYHPILQKNWNLLFVIPSVTGVDLLGRVLVDAADAASIQELCDCPSCKGSVDLEALRDDRRSDQLEHGSLFHHFVVSGLVDVTALFNFSRTLPFDHFFFFAEAPALVLAKKSFMVFFEPVAPFLSSFFFGGIFWVLRSPMLPM